MPVYRHWRDTPDPDDGFAVTNAYDVPLWDFVQARDLDALGYPISQRWTDGPFTLQAFQKVILQWDPGKSPDELLQHAGRPGQPLSRDRAAASCRPTRCWRADRGMDFGTVTRNHLALLEQNPAHQATFPGGAGLVEPLRAAYPV